MPAAYHPSLRANWAGDQPISMLMSRALASPELISLAAGFVDQQSLPARETEQALSDLFKSLSTARAALQYGTTSGYAPLRELLLERTFKGQTERAARGSPTIDQVVLTAGSNQLLHLVLESLADPGDIVLCAAPTYLVFLGTVANVGARSVGVATDSQGLIPEALEATLAQLEDAGELPRVRAIYLVNYFDNPCGITMPADRVRRTIEIAKQWSRRGKIYVLADEAYRELRYAGDDVPSAMVLDEDHDTVLGVGTFSKSYSPGMRVGWGILPAELVSPVCCQKGNIDFGSPNFNQHLMHRVLERGLFDEHVRRIRGSYRGKLQAMLSAAEAELGSVPGVTWEHPMGGLYVWVQLPEGVDAGPEGRLFDAAVRNGVLYVPGQYCYPSGGEPVRRNTLRLSFGVQTGERIQAGVAALARAIREL